MKKVRLSFARGNKKLARAIHTFSLPAGWSCPFARECEARADRATGTIANGEHQIYRCYAASQEAMYPSARNSRWKNYEALRAAQRSGGEQAMRELIERSLPSSARYVRIHVAGDFFSSAYFRAWCAVAAGRPDVRFYAYTKSAKYWIDNRANIPVNLVLTYSLGGRDDALAAEHGLRTARVVFSEEQAERLGLEIDRDDSHAMEPGGDFALLIHGMQSWGMPGRASMPSELAA